MSLSQVSAASLTDRLRTFSRVIRGEVHKDRTGVDELNELEALVLARTARELQAEARAEEGPESEQTGPRLKILLLSAKSLMKSDGFMGKSDPYVIATLTDRSAQTNIIKKTLNPTWNEAIYLEFDEEDDYGETLRLDVMDWDPPPQDHDPLGHVEVPLADLRTKRMLTPADFQPAPPAKGRSSAASSSRTKKEGLPILPPGGKKSKFLSQSRGWGAGLLNFEVSIEHDAPAAVEEDENPPFGTLAEARKDLREVLYESPELGGALLELDRANDQARMEVLRFCADRCAANFSASTVNLAKKQAKEALLREASKLDPWLEQRGKKALKALSPELAEARAEIVALLNTDWGLQQLEVEVKKARAGFPTQNPF